MILGDGGFPAENCLLTPYLNAEVDSKEARYNIAHKKARNVIERTYGVLKMRLRCLSGDRALHYKPKKAVKIVYSCIILHNICIARNVPLFEDIEAVEDENEPEYQNGNANIAGRRQRDRYNALNF